MLDSVLRLVKDNTAMGGAKKPLELMTEEELEAELRRQVIEAAMSMTKVEVIDEVRKLPVVEASPAISVGGVQAIPANVGEERGGEISPDIGIERMR